LFNPCSTVTRNFVIKEKSILYAGTLRDRKGYNRLLEAFSKIAPKYPDWKLVFAGNGEIGKAKQLALDLRIENQTQFLGWISGEDKTLAFQKASIFCLPSWGEGFPMGVLDAWSFGLPVVTTPVGGIVDIVTHGVNGLIFDVKSIIELSKCLEQLIVSESLRDSIIINTDKLVNNEFSIGQMAKELDKIYTSLEN
jgi:glycosyltransferase involved in cell wall biosynthesis